MTDARQLVDPRRVVQVLELAAERLADGAEQRGIVARATRQMLKPSWNVDRRYLNEETDTRFWARTGYRPGQRLDPANPTDKVMLPVWMDIFRQVQR